MMNISRRSLFYLGSAADVVPFMPSSVRAQNPADVIAAGEQVYDAVREVVSLLSTGGSSDDARWTKLESEVGQVLEKADQIIEEIHELKLYFDESFYNEGRDLARRDLLGYEATFDIMVSSPATTQSSMQDLFDNVSHATSVLGGYDFAIYIPYSAGVSMALALAKKSGFSAAKIEAAREEYSKAYTMWLDPKNPKSITTKIGALAADVNSRINALNARPRNYSNNARTVNGSNDQVCTQTDDVVISGTFPSFSESTSSPISNCHAPFHPPGCTDPRMARIANCGPRRDYKALASEMLSASFRRAGLTYPPESRSSAILFASSATLDSFNAEVASIQQEKASVLILQHMSKQIGDLHDQLLLPAH